MNELSRGHGGALPTEGRTVKQASATLIARLGFAWAARSIARSCVVVLTYHGVLPGPEIEDGYLCRNMVTDDAFAWQMNHLARHYRCLPLSEVIDTVRRGGRLPANSASVTFDDGFRNNCAVAFPILRELGIPATIFLTTGFVGRGTKMLWTEELAWRLRHAVEAPPSVTVRGQPISLSLATLAEREASAQRLLAALKRTPANERRTAAETVAARLRIAEGRVPSPARYAFMDWDEARALADSGLVEVGSHTVSHPVLSQLPDEESHREIQQSKADIEEQLGRPCRLFAYPNGSAADFSKRDRDLVRGAGYAGAVSQIGGLNGSGTDPYAYRRVNIGLGHSRELFALSACGLWPLVQRLTSRH